MKLSTAKRGALLLAALLLATLIAPPLFFYARVALRESSFPPLPKNGSDGGDASRMAGPRAARVLHPDGDFDQVVAQIRAALKAASRRGQAVSLAGNRHSQGGQTISAGGLQIDTQGLRRLSLDPATGVLTVGAGERWTDVISYLDARARSVWIMQSDSNFSVGGSLSVNCHGWQSNRPPIASTVESLRLMTAEGRILTCSRTQNAELFSLALGGYGLFGVILDARLQTVPNVEYRLTVRDTSMDSFPAAWKALLSRDPAPPMLYGRLCVAPSCLGRDVALNIFEPLEGVRPAPAKLPPDSFLKRIVFRGQVGSAYGKRWRWRLEGLLGEHTPGSSLSRNQLMIPTAHFYMNRDPTRTDILQEYFLPPGAAPAFASRLTDLVHRRHADLLNVTLRDVKADPDTFLAYARGDRVAFVMYFNQSRDAAGDLAMRAFTRDLIDAALNLKGTYYLPYRLHATQQQFRRAYPQAARFFELKRKYDKGEVFSNSFYEAYGR